LLSLLLLLMGMLVYFLFRDTGSLVAFAWLPRPVFAGSPVIQLPPSALSNIVMHNLAGMLWLVSGILFFRFVWFRKPREQKIYIGCFCGVAALLEVGQLSQRIPGTFDARDLLFMGLGAFVEGALHKIFVERKVA